MFCVLLNCCCLLCLFVLSRSLSPNRCPSCSCSKQLKRIPGQRLPQAQPRAQPRARAPERPRSKQLPGLVAVLVAAADVSSAGGRFKQNPSSTPFSEISAVAAAAATAAASAAASPPFFAQALIQGWPEPVLIPRAASASCACLLRILQCLSRLFVAGRGLCSGRGLGPDVDEVVALLLGRLCSYPGPNLCLRAAPRPSQQ